jgi:ribonucleoside-diphosphate reductase alpha chain
METKFQDDFSADIWRTTYKYKDEQSINDSFRRVAKAVASVEKTQALKELWSQHFYELLSGFKMTCGGRILANAGTDWNGVTLMNCFVGPKPDFDQDSIEGIFDVLTSQVLTLKSEGGWGMNFSFIRPRGSFIHGIGVETPGAVKYMELFNTSSDVITAGSGKQKKDTKGKIKIRKGAMMGVLDVWHPDIEEFITAKLKEGRLNKFNLSVNCSNEFMDRVEAVKAIQATLDSHLAMKNPPNDHVADCRAMLEIADKWELIFPDTRHPKYKEEWDGNMAAWKAKGYDYKVHKVIKVSDLWNLIMTSTYTRNDPGVLFLDRANETHLWNYAGVLAHIAATNPCGEQCLPFGMVCNLASMNLTQFVTEDGKFDFDKFIKYVAWAVRFLDDVNDLSDAPLPQYLQSIRNRRRIGLGVMGWGSMLYMMRIRFASPEAAELQKKIMRAFTDIAVKASISLANEKGHFSGCDPAKHCKHPFFKRIGISDATLCDMGVHGIRNSALFSCQPNGNTSVLANIVSGGIEPVFAPEFTRTVIVDGCPSELLSHAPKYWEGEFKETDTFKWVQEGGDKILRGVYKGVVYKIDPNRGLTKEVGCEDYGVRWLKAKGLWDAKAPWAVTASSLSVDEHVSDMTGFGFWMDSSMSKTVNIANDYPYDKFQALYLTAYKSGVLKGITTYRANTMMNVLTENKFVAPRTIAPKRPEKVKGELHHFVIEGKKYYTAVGLDDNNNPFEVFTGINQSRGEIYIPKIVKKGIIQKKNRGDYVFLGDDGETYELTNGHSNDTADALTRSISGGLRHGEDISYVVHQLEKTEGPMICFSKVLGRTLKKYIKDGTSVAGEECPECKGKLVRQEGCCVCPACGFSKCS